MKEEELEITEGFFTNWKPPLKTDRKK